MYQVEKTLTKKILIFKNQHSINLIISVMKKVFLSVAVALGVFTTAAAQEAGQFWTGGTVGIWSSKVKGGDSQLSFKVMPEFGYNFTDNLAVGIALGGAHTHGESTKFDNNILQAAEGSTNEYTVSPFLRYSFIKGDLGSIFFDGGVGYTWAKGCSGGLKANQLEVGIRPGLALNVSNNVSLISKFGFLGYQNTKTDVVTEAGKGSVKTNSFGLDLDMRNIQFGAIVKF